MPYLWALAFDKNKGGLMGDFAEAKNYEHSGVASYASYQKGCHCTECRAQNAKYQREYQARRRSVMPKRGRFVVPNMSGDAE